MTGAERHAQRLLRCYPRVWRQRYGDELAALLVDDLADRPRSLRRDLDVVRAGCCARLSACGLAGGPVQDRPAATAVAAAAALGFLASALSIWTQLADGWLTAPPDTPAVTISLIALSTWLGGLLLVAAVISVRIAVAVVRTLYAGRARLMLRPLAMLAASTAVLIVGGGLMASRWPTARALHHGDALSLAARISWAATDTVSTFWTHPHRLLALPGTELAWMVVSPIAVLAFSWSLVRVIRVTGLRCPRLPGSSPWIGGLVVLPCVVSAAWVLGSQHAARASFRAGTLDLVLIAMMVLAPCLLRKAHSAATR